MTKRKNGFGSDPYKWVSGATKQERQASRDGDIVLFDDGRPCGGSYGTTLRMMVWKNGRYVPRVPDSSVIAAYENDEEEIL